MMTRLFATRFSFCVSICILLSDPGMGWLTAAELNRATNHSNRDPTTARAPQKVPDFELKDQHNVTRTYQFPRDKISLLTVADRKGSDQIEAWVRPIKQRYGNRIDIDGVADMSTVPTGLRTLVRNAFKDQLTY